MIRMTKAVTGSVATCAALGALLATSSIAQGSTSCNPPASRTLRTNRFARVYARHGKAYACLRSNGRTRLLTAASPTADVFALGGKWVGWSTNTQDEPTVTVMYLPSGSVNHRERYPWNWYTETGNPSVYSIDYERLVVLSDGAAAWEFQIATGSHVAAVVYGTDRRNRPPRELSDDALDNSLHFISGKTVGWRNANGRTGRHTLY